MPSSQSDYILRLIEQLGATLRRLRERLARGVPAAPEVLDEAERSQAELLGPLWPTLRSLDAATAAALVPEDRQLQLWVDLLHLEAEAAGLLGDAARAEGRRARADALDLALRTRRAGG